MQTNRLVRLFISILSWSKHACRVGENWEYLQLFSSEVWSTWIFVLTGLCKDANQEHARDLPIMNGIKEAIKSIGVLDAGSLDYQEAMSNLSSRLNILQVTF